MSKLDEVKEVLRDSFGMEYPNWKIAAQVGCDEGLVRKARPLVRVELLEEENARLKDELGQYRRAARPRPRKHDDAGPLPLWERLGPDGEITTAIPMLNEATP